jgi:hypothetical protein
MNTYFLLFIVWVIVSAVALYVVINKAQYTISASVSIRELENNIADYKKFFLFLNRKSQGRLRGDGKGTKKQKWLKKLRELLYEVKKWQEIRLYTSIMRPDMGAYQFISAYANLTEVQRSTFAENTRLMYDVLVIYKAYHRAVIHRRYADVANSLANYYRIVRGDNTQEKTSFEINDRFGKMLGEVLGYLSENKIFMAHHLLLKEEDSKNITDLEMLVLHYLLSRLSYFFQGISYLCTKEANENVIKNLKKEITGLNKYIKGKKYKIVLKSIPWKPFNPIDRLS